MSNTPSLNPREVWQNSGGADFIQMKSPSGAVLAWIDSLGAPQGALAGGSIPPTKTLYVDNNRTDSYTPNGSLTKPFLSIMAAVNQIAANGDNNTIPYVVSIIPGTYPETISLSNTALVNITFIGYGVLVLPGSTAHGAEAINNDNLRSVKFVGMKFNVNAGSDGHSFNFSSTTNNTSFLSGTFPADPQGCAFTDCELICNSDFYGTNGGVFYFTGCYLTVPININNCLQGIAYGCTFNTGSQFNVTSVGANPHPTGWTTTQIQVFFCISRATMTCDAGSSVNCHFSRLQSNVTIGGTLFSHHAAFTATLTIQAGGTAQLDATTYVTLSNSGTITFPDNFAAGPTIVGGNAQTAPSGALGIGSGSASSATAGADTLPANPAGFLVWNLAGSVIKIAYYNA